MTTQSRDLKTLCYYRSGGASNDGYVDYAIIGNTCIFTGITRRTRTTVMGAESIIVAICNAERITPDAVTFCDLQTSMHDGSKDPGEFSLEELEIDYSPSRGFETRTKDFILLDVGPVHVTNWKLIPCPPDVQALFVQHIGDNPYELKNVSDHRRYHERSFRQ